MTIRLSLLLAFIAGSASTSAAQDLVRVPAGTYDASDQITTLTVRVSVSEFLLGAAEVTQTEYEAITSSNPSVYKGADRPVENVSWWDAIRYCNLRSAKEALTPCYDLASGERDPACTGYRLPTEAEWVVAAGPMPRDAQLLDVAHLGVSQHQEPGRARAGPHAGNGAGSLPETGPLGRSSTCAATCGNGLADYFDPVTSPDAVRDPSGPRSGLARVIRGGSFVSSTSRWSRDLRSSMDPAWRSRFTGFRVARSIQEKTLPVPVAADAFFRRYNEAPKGFESSVGPLTALAPGWKENAAKIRAKWDTLLSVPKLPRGSADGPRGSRRRTAQFRGPASRARARARRLGKGLRPEAAEQRPAPIARHDRAVLRRRYARRR